jgi:methionyl-tRNA formyltransferase
VSKVRILFLGTPEFAVQSLKALIKDPHFDIVGVISQPDKRSGRKMQLQPSPVKALALAHNLTTFTPQDINTPESLKRIAEFNAEAVAVVAFGQIVSQAFLDLFPRMVVNVHGSLLPRWRGAAPIQRAIMAGDTETGVCLQIMVRKLDAGDVLGFRKVKLSESITARELHDQLMVLGGDLLHIELMDYIRGNLSGVPQDAKLVTFAKKIEKSEGLIDWNKPVEEIHNHVRGMTLGPGTWTHRNGQTLKIAKTTIEDRGLQLAPGMVYRVNHDELIVSCGRGLLKILEVQPESRDRMLIKSYLRGYPVTMGEKFG